MLNIAIIQLAFSPVNDIYGGRSTIAVSWFPSSSTPASTSASSTSASASTPAASSHSPRWKRNHRMRTLPTSTVRPDHPPSPEPRRNFRPPLRTGTASPRTSSSRAPPFSSPSRRRRLSITVTSHCDEDDEDDDEDEDADDDDSRWPRSTRAAAELPRPCALHSLVSRCRPRNPYSRRR